MDAPPADEPTITDDQPQPRPSRRKWWLGGGVVLAVVVAVVIVVVVRATGKPPAAPVFTHFPAASCAIITEATADTYAPGTTCSGHDVPMTGGWIDREVSWLPPGVHSSMVTPVISVSFMVITDTDADGEADKWMSDETKDWYGLPELHTRPIAGLGDRASYLYSTKYGYVARLIVRTRNVVAEADYSPADLNPNLHFSDQDGERAVQTMLAQVIRQFS